MHIFAEHHDELLLHELKQALAETGVAPPEVLAAAKGAFAWRTVDADLALLTYDSARSPQFQSAVRAQRAARQLTFQVGSVRIDLAEACASRLRLPPPNRCCPSGPSSELDGVKPPGRPR